MHNVIYSITSPSGKRYIGSTHSFNGRKKSHIYALKKGKHHSRPLQRAWDKYCGNLEFKPLLVCKESDLFFYEQLFIDLLKPEYNVSPSASGTRGLTWSAESREKISEIRRRQGAALTAEERQKLAASAKILLHSPEARQKSQAARNSPEWRTAQSQRLKGKKQSAETIAKRSASLIGRIVSLETRAKIALQRGWKHSEEAKQKMRGRQISEAERASRAARATGRKNRLGSSVSAETRAIISAKLKGRPRSAESVAKQRATCAARRGLLRDGTAC